MFCPRGRPVESRRRPGCCGGAFTVRAGRGWTGVVAWDAERERLLSARPEVDRRCRPGFGQAAFTVRAGRGWTVDVAGDADRERLLSARARGGQKASPGTPTGNVYCPRGPRADRRCGAGCPGREGSVYCPRGRAVESRCRPGCCGGAFTVRAGDRGTEGVVRVSGRERLLSARAADGQELSPGTPTGSVYCPRGPPGDRRRRPGREGERLLSARARDGE